MNSKISRIPFLLAIISGFLILRVAKIEPYPIPLVLYCSILPVIFQYVWPLEPWRWLFWIIGPSLILTLLSVAFVGKIDVFVNIDLPLFFIAIVSGSVGYFVFVFYKKQITRNEKD